MQLVRTGDVVARKSYGEDIFFRVVKISRNSQGQEVAYLKGMHIRLYADSPLYDLKQPEERVLQDYAKQFERITHERIRKLMKARWKSTGAGLAIRSRLQSEFFEMPGRVLHLDGDEEYLDECLRTYRQLNISAKGLCFSEIEQPKVILKVLKENPTDILVLTGHDSLVKGCKDFSRLENYRSSACFVESVAIARSFEPNKDSLVIFAGACQSHYESILQAGANFASSPKRVFIHAFDPVFIVERVALTPMHDTVSLKEIIDNTVTGTDGVGGIETRGQLRLGYPRSPY